MGAQQPKRHDFELIRQRFTQKFCHFRVNNRYLHPSIKFMVLNGKKIRLGEIIKDILNPREQPVVFLRSLIQLN